MTLLFFIVAGMVAAIFNFTTTELLLMFILVMMCQIGGTLEAFIKSIKIEAKKVMEQKP